MDESAKHAEASKGWLEALAESEAELAAGQTVPGTVVRQHLLDSIARLEATWAEAEQHSPSPSTRH